MSSSTTQQTNLIHSKKPKISGFRAGAKSFLSRNKSSLKTPIQPVSMKTTFGVGSNIVCLTAMQANTSTNTPLAQNNVPLSTTVTSLTAGNPQPPDNYVTTPAQVNNVIDPTNSASNFQTGSLLSTAQTSITSPSNQHGISSGSSVALASVVPAPAVIPVTVQSQSSSIQSTTTSSTANHAALYSNASPALTLTPATTTPSSPPLPGSTAIATTAASINPSLSQTTSQQSSQQTLLDQAILKLDLTSEEKKALKIDVLMSPTENLQVLNGIQEQAKRAMEVCRQNRLRIKFGNKTIILRDVMNKVLFYAEKLKDVGDAINQYDSHYTTLPWAAIRLVLTMSLTERDRREMALFSIEAVSRELAICNWFERLYLKDMYGPRTELQNQLETALVELYSTALEVLVKLYRYFNKTKVKQLMVGATTKDETPVLLEGIKMKGKTVSRIANLLSEQARADGQNFLDQSDQVILTALKQLDHIPQLENKLGDLHKDFLNQTNCKLW